MTEQTDVQTREQWLNDFCDMARPIFEELGHPIPPLLRMSVGFTTGGHRSSAIAEYIPSSASADGHGEIFVSPTISAGDSRVAGVLTHELIHATGIKGHGKAFKALATKLGLTGQMRATTEGQEFHRWSAPILKIIGPMPYGAIRADFTPPKPTVPTFGIKVECSACGWLARVSSKWVDPYSYLACPDPACDGELIVTRKANNPGYEA